MKRNTAVKVTDKDSALYGKTGRFLFKANDNHAHVVMDGGNMVTLHRLAFKPINVYSPPIVDESHKRLAVALEKVYNYAENFHKGASVYNTDYAKGYADASKALAERLKAILDGKY